MRSAAAGLCAAAIVATVIPLVVLQVPDAIAWSPPAHLAAGGPVVVASLLRASGLALPAMAIAGSLAALAVRWLRSGPVLLTGLLVVAVADTLGDAAPTVALIGVDRMLHGAGAGVAMAGVIAVVTERRTDLRTPGQPRQPGQQRQPQLRPPRPATQPTSQPGPAQPAQQPATQPPMAGTPGAGRPFLAGWFAAVMVAGLAAAPELMRHGVGSGDWHVALQPCPWLTGAALALAALYATLAEGTATRTARTAFPAAERAQLALLAAPVTGICAIAMAVTYRGDKAVVAAAFADAIALAGIAVTTARAGTAGRFAVVCAVTGFTLAPAAGAVTALTAPSQPVAPTGAAVLAAALGGAALALLTRRPHPRALTAAGLLLAALGLGALDLAGLAAPSDRMLTVLCVPVAGGLSAALTASLRSAGTRTGPAGTRTGPAGTRTAPAAMPVGPAGALAGVVILLAGLVAGYLAAGAVQLRALTGARTLTAAHAAHAALATAAGHLALLAAAVTGVAALALTCTSGRRSGRRAVSGSADIAGGAPVPGAGDIPDHG